MTEEKIDLLYVACQGRSGSTLLSLLSKTDPTIYNLGEVGNIIHVLTDKNKNHKCGCGSVITECEFWKQVVSTNPVFQEVIRDAEAGLKVSNANYRELHHHIMKSALQSSGRKTILDKSMDPARLSLLLNDGRFNIKIIHLVRDGRAVANSWRNYAKRKGRQWIWARRLTAAFRWRARNLDILRLFERSENYILVRYEDLVCEPENTLRKLGVCANTGHPADADQTVEHFVGGNRMRFSFDKIEKDEKYKSEVPRVQWYLMTVFLGPLLRRFGYGLSK